MTHLLHLITGNPLRGETYQLWSGIGAVISENIPRTVMLAVVWHHINCPEPGCWRPGKRHREHRCKRHYKPRA